MVFKNPVYHLKSEESFLQPGFPQKTHSGISNGENMVGWGSPYFQPRRRFHAGVPVLRSAVFRGVHVHHATRLLCGWHTAYADAAKSLKAQGRGTPDPNC